MGKGIKFFHKSSPKERTKLKEGIKLRFSIKGKLYIAFTILMLVLIGLGTYSSYNLKTINDNVNEMMHYYLPRVDYAHSINTLISDFRRYEFAYISAVEQFKKDEYKESMDKIRAEIDSLLKEYEKTISNNTDKQLYTSIKTQWTGYMDQSRYAIGASNEGKTAEALNVMNNNNKYYAVMNEVTTKMLKLNQDNIDAVGDKVEAIYNQMGVNIIIVLASAFIVCIAIAAYLILSITVPIKKLKATAKMVSSGDLSGKCNLRNKDEFGQLAASFNEMIANLRELINAIVTNAESIAVMSGELSSSAEQNAKATEQIAMSVADISEGANSQAVKAENTNTVVNTLIENMKEVSVNTENAKTSSDEASCFAAEGNKSIGTVIEEMSNINEAIKETSEVVHLLDEKVKEIGSIISVINEISEQTNLLALNAAIEAARAGEQGRGFAVVADEVRKLAEQSGKSTANIEKIIMEIKMETGRVVKSIQKGVGAVDKGIDVVQNTGASFTNILNAFEKVTDQMAIISQKANAINNDSSNVLGNMSDVLETSKTVSFSTQSVASAVQEQTASMEEISSSAYSLTDIVERLENTVKRFKL